MVGCGGHGALGNYSNKEVLEPCYFKGGKGSNILTPFSKKNVKQKRILEFICFVSLKALGESFLYIAFVGF